MRVFLTLLVACVLSSPSQAQRERAFDYVELRVTATGPGDEVTVDRGASDRLAVDDPVQFYPREGGVHWGTVVRVHDRIATVRLFDPKVVPAAGTPGKARIPKDRHATRDDEPRAALPEHPPWENADEEWAPGEPLLTRVEAVPPEARPRMVSGRFYSIVDQTWASESQRTDGFYRAGTDIAVDNPFGRGGNFHFDGEVNYRDTQVPDDDDDDGGRIRLDRFSYGWGGHRYAPQRWEVGRFLQRGLPEFGVLDGVEWGLRRANGHRFGASTGFMPEPDADFETGQDLQFAAYYEWVADRTEELSVAGGFQKTFHDLKSDRDLLVARVRYLPIEGWHVFAAAWIDIYTASDDARGAGVGFTQVHASTGRRWSNGDGLDLTYGHIEFPELLRSEFTPVTQNQLADDHNDRLALAGSKSLTAERRLHGQLGVWADEDEAGGDAEVGLDVADLLLEHSRADLTLFSTLGEFTTALGVRALYGRPLAFGRWDVLYELSDQNQLGFDGDNDDLFQHRLRASHDFHTTSGWSLSTYAEGVLWADQGGVSVGFYLQRSF